MEENKEDIAQYHKTKRKKKKIKLIIVMLIFFVISLVLLGRYLILNKKHIINFKENSKIKYNVNLIENEFYTENSLSENVNVIASLIKNIDVEFKYNLDLAEEIDYTYSYNILAEIDVKDKSKSSLIYESEQEIFKKEEQQGKANKIAIAEKVNIDYNQYNDQINKLVELYKLDNTTSELSLNLYVTVINKATGEKINKESNVMSIVMPLASKTVEISVNENVKDSLGEIVIKEHTSEDTEYYLIVGILMLIIATIVFICLIRYNLKTRSAEKMYEAELKKILFDYKSYIQKINSKVEYKDYKIIKIDTFNELIGMREELQSPILMYTEEENLRTVFMIISGNILFVNILGAKEIRKNLIKKSKEKGENQNEKND